jgi:short-subunit dehydrogenase
VSAPTFERALVTGASSGLGAAFARALARRGTAVVLVARRRDRLEALARDLGASSEVLVADLDAEPGLAAVEERLRRGDVDLLVNNAGFSTGGPFARADVAAEEGMLRVHLLASLRLMRAALPAMIERGRGAVINVSSLGALTPSFPLNATYGASKAYLVSLSESVAAELRGTGVSVQALCPGFTHTEFHKSPNKMKGTPAFMWMDPEPVVEASLAAVGKRVLVVPGLANRLVATLVRFLPRGLVSAVIARGARPRRPAARTSAQQRS